MIAVPSVGAPHWSPDGRWLSYARSSGFELFDPVTRERRMLSAAAGVFWHAWSGDSRTIFGAMLDQTGRWVIIAAPISGERPRVVAYADHPLSQLYSAGLVASGGLLYFPLMERKADVWVGEVVRR